MLFEHKKKHSARSFQPLQPSPYAEMMMILGLLMVQAGALDIPTSNTQTAVAYCTAAADTLKSNDNLQQDTETMIGLFETVRAKPKYERIRAVDLLDRSLGIIDRQRHFWLYATRTRRV